LRHEQHNAEDNTGWTARFRPWLLVYTEAHPDYTSARRRENDLKAQKGGKGLFAKTGLDPGRFGRGA